MAVGVTDRLWEVADIVTVLEDWEESNLTDYIGRHWRGEQNVVWSLLVNCIAVPAATLAGAALLAVYGGVPERVLAWGIPVYDAEDVLDLRPHPAEAAVARTLALREIAPRFRFLLHRPEHARVFRSALLGLAGVSPCRRRPPHRPRGSGDPSPSRRAPCPSSRPPCAPARSRHRRRHEPSCRNTTGFPSSTATSRGRAGPPCSLWRATPRSASRPRWCRRAAVRPWPRDVPKRQRRSPSSAHAARAGGGSRISPSVVCVGAGRHGARCDCNIPESRRSLGIQNCCHHRLCWLSAHRHWPLQ